MRLNLIIYRLLKRAFQEVLNNAPLFESLPKQTIHHDLLIFNLLMDREGGKMNGVLDFDFASDDIRALELAIAINHLLQQSDHSWLHIDLFLAEYANYMAIMSEQEIRCIPVLMRMYYVSLLSIYIGQYDRAGYHSLFPLYCASISDQNRMVRGE